MAAGRFGAVLGIALLAAGCTGASDDAPPPSPDTKRVVVSLPLKAVCAELDRFVADHFGETVSVLTPPSSYHGFADDLRPLRDHLEPGGAAIVASLDDAFHRVSSEPNPNGSRHVLGLDRAWDALHRARTTCRQAGTPLTHAPTMRMPMAELAWWDGKVWRKDDLPVKVEIRGSGRSDR